MPHPPSRNIRARKHARVELKFALAARFAEQLAALRAERGETQKQLAARLGMTESMISRFESGGHLPNLTTLCRIAGAFGCKLEIAFHQHDRDGAGGVRHKHAHRHNDVDHRNGGGGDAA